MITAVRSRALFRDAQELFAGGVNSPVRAFAAVGGAPRFFDRGEGPYLVDVDGNRLVDYVLSWGPLILGHAHPTVVDALRRTLLRGTGFGAPNRLELELARRIQERFPGMQLMRFVNSGTEATMSALRVARAFTGRSKIIKFAGCYHGHADPLLVQGGSGIATLGLPDSPGVPPGTAADTLIAPFNDLSAVERLFARTPHGIAAVILEPVPGNMGVIPPADGFLAGLRALTRAEGAVLIFDEVMSGFRAHPSGAQVLYQVQPDLTTLGKVVGGGLPVGVYGGRRDIMELVAPAGPVYQAGTLAGNPLAMCAGIVTLDLLAVPGVWKRIEADTAALAAMLRDQAARYRIPLRVNAVGTMLTAFFRSAPVENWESARQSDTTRFAAFFRALLAHGVYWPPSQFEAAFLSAAHAQRERDRTTLAVQAAFAG